MHEIFNAKDFNKEWFDEGTNNNTSAPARGKINVMVNIFVTLKEKKFNINIL